MSRCKRREELRSIIGTDANSTVDNKSMLNALLDAVCAADDTVEQHDDSHVQHVTETKVPKAAESDSTLLFPPSCENAMGVSLSQKPKITNALLTNAEMVAGKEEDVDGSDAGSDWDEDAPEPPTTSADRLTGGNMNIENDGVVTIGLTRGNVENKALKRREEKTDTIADSDLDQVTSCPSFEAITWYCLP